MISRDFKSALRAAVMNVAALAALLLVSAGIAGADDQVPVPWNGFDLGGPIPAGTAKADNGVFTLTGGGGALTGMNDRFHFVYQSITGDFTLVARVSSAANGRDLSGSGIMVRQALEAGSDFVAVTLMSGGVVASSYRTLYTPKTASETVNANSPVWVKLVKRGTSMQSFTAADRSGVPEAWNQIGGNQPIPSGMVYVGLCQASGPQGGVATFDHLSLVTGPQLVFDDGVYTITPVSAQNMILIPAGNSVKLAASTNASNQKWRLITRNGVYSLQPLTDPSRVLSVPGAKTDNGSPVAITSDQGQNTQRWFITINSNDTYGLHPQFNPGICLDDFQGSGSPDAVIDIWNFSDTDPHLQWLINSAQ